MKILHWKSLRNLVPKKLIWLVGLRYYRFMILKFLFIFLEQYLSNKHQKLIRVFFRFLDICREFSEKLSTKFSRMLLNAAIVTSLLTLIEIRYDLSFKNKLSTNNVMLRNNIFKLCFSPNLSKISWLSRYFLHRISELSSSPQWIYLHRNLSNRTKCRPLLRLQDCLLAKVFKALLWCVDGCLKALFCSGRMWLMRYVSNCNKWEEEEGLVSSFIDWLIY